MKKMTIYFFVPLFGITHEIFDESKLFNHQQPDQQVELIEIPVTVTASFR